jgi:hypothetical protein
MYGSRQRLFTATSAVGTDSMSSRAFALAPSNISTAVAAD